jgi:soluble lytic murein transglycosylase
MTPPGASGRITRARPGRRAGGQAAAQRVAGSSTRSTTARRAAAARRRSARRRRRFTLVLGAAGLLLLAALLVAPLFNKAVNNLVLPLRHQDVIRQQARAKHLDPALIAAVIYAESKFDPRPSPAGAQGLMQILPDTARFLAHRSGATTFTTADLATPQVNIAYGSYYLRYLLDRYRGDKILALAAYNAGETNVDRWVAGARAEGHRLLAHEIPFPETRAYVLKVLGKQQDYRNTYASELGY